MTYSPEALKLLNSIASECGLTDKTMCINVALSMMVKSGAPVDVAFDALFGAGAYKEFAGQVYRALRGEVQA